MKISNRQLGALLLAPLLLASTQLQAELGADSQLETVVVRAARIPLPLSALGSSVTVLDQQQLQQRQVAPLAEILRAVPGVAVNRAGVMGSQTQLRIRGGEANQVLVFIDGIKVNDAAQNGEFNMAHVLNYDLESVEVIRGPQSALWGSDALSGVINITTREAAPGIHGNAFAEGGSDSWQNVGASGAYGTDTLKLRLSGNSLETDGDNISRDGNEQDGYRNETLNFGLGYAFSEVLSVKSNLRYTAAKNDYDGVDYNTGLPADSVNHSDVEQLYARIAASYTPMNTRWSHQLSYTLTDTDNKNRSENEFAGNGFDITKADAELAIVAWQSTFQLFPDHLLTAAYERQDEDFKQRGPGNFGDPNRDENMATNSFILEYRAELTSQISLLASARHDNNSDFDDKTTGRISAAWRINAERTKLRAAYGTGIKNPTFTERYGYFNDFIGNPDLKPEQSIGWEVGIDQQLLNERLNLSLTWFHEQLEDEINGFVYDPNSGGFTAANGNDNSERQGLEFSGNWLLLDNLQLGFAYTWLDATEEDSFSGHDNDEIRRPQNIANANLNWSLFSQRLNLNLNVDYNSQQDDFFFPPYPPYQETVELDDFTLLTVAASYQLSKQLQLFARLENALDEDYEEVFGFVAPGRTARMGVRYNLDRE